MSAAVSKHRNERNGQHRFERMVSLQNTMQFLGVSGVHPELGGAIRLGGAICGGCVSELRATLRSGGRKLGIDVAEGGNIERTWGCEEGSC